MRNTVIKLKSIKLNNFKNVKNGKIEFKEGREVNSISNILGIYGQNGSGKTSVINAIYLLKRLASGQGLIKKHLNYINSESDFATLNFEFRIWEKEELYRVFYKFEIRKKEIRKSNFEYNMPFITELYDENYNENFKFTKDFDIEVSKEKLSYSKFEDNMWKNRVTIIDYDIDNKDYAFRPIKNYKEVANTTDKKVSIGIAKGLSEENATSFIFNIKTFALLISSFSKTNKNHSKIITSIRNFAILNLFVIQNDDLGVINSNILIPFSFMLDNNKKMVRGNINIKLFDTSTIEIDKFDTVKKILEQINIVLSTLVPNLKIELKNYGKETTSSGKEGYKVELLSLRGKNAIPLKYESDGIKKIISILSVLIGMYNNENILVAIDELDAGIFEYLLGEILEILSKNARGQLIFTSHNLRALEKLNKDLVIFTTTNPENRYIGLNSIKGMNNLRDFYYRGIVLGGQREELYDETNKYEISYAFQKAWMINHDINNESYKNNIDNEI